MEDIRLDTQSSSEIKNIGYAQIERQENHRFAYKTGKALHSFIFVRGGGMRYRFPTLKKTILLEKVLSASVDFETSDYDFLDFHGGWGKERFLERTPLHHGVQSIDSKRGSSSHQLNPFFVLASKETNEECLF